jgi:hypothetical protein
MQHGEKLLDATERRVLRALVDRVGILAAVDRLGVGRESVARAVAGMSIRKGTLLILRAGLATVESEVRRAAG